MKLSHADAPPPFQPGKPIGNVYYGACSWTDRTLIDAGTFYPDNARTASLTSQPVPHRRGGRHLLCAAVGTQCAASLGGTNPTRFRLQHEGLWPVYPSPCGRRAAPSCGQGAVAGRYSGEEPRLLRDIPEEAEKLTWEMQAQALAPLAAAGKLGCMLFQFPHWFTPGRAHIRYLEQLRDRSDWPLAIEFRGGGWMTDNYRARTLALLEKLGLAYVVVDEPQGFRSSTPPVVAATGPLAVVRFHGHNAETYEKPNLSAAERFRYLYSEEGLNRWVTPIRRLAEQADRVHVLMNNCYGDYGVRNARQLAELLRGGMQFARGS